MRSCSALFAAAICAVSLSARAFTAEELIARNLEARGGVARIKALRSLRLTGRISVSMGESSMEGRWSLLYKRQGKLRSEYTLQGLTGITAWDGTEGWELQPFGGRRDPQRTSADEAKEFAHSADLDGPLVDWKEKGHRVEYLGTEDVDGTQAHKLRISRQDGDVTYLYLDPDWFLEIRRVDEGKVRGVERVSETDLGNYEQVEGVWVPLSLDSGAPGRPKASHITYERAEGNVEVDDAVFRFPTSAAGLGAVIAARPGAPIASSAAPKAKGRAGPPSLDSGVISGLGIRNIGSAAMSGRVSAVAAFVEGGKTTLYVGAASGGLWRSFDSGTTFKPVFDKQPVQSIGAIAIDPSDSKTIWVGTGESWTRNSVSVGNGIYRSNDAGATWTYLGLPESERIARIIVSPKSSEVVYACVPGKLWSDSAERGLYRTGDGGKSWQLILKGENLSTGCSSLAMDPQNPDVLFAGLWDFRRKGWTFRSGGDGPEARSGSGMFRSVDGGKSWSPLTAATAKGLPAAPWGRVEIAIAPSDSKIVYAMLEGKDSALYRSSDGGATWEARDKSQSMVWRPFYFDRLVVDPRNPERLFKGGGNLIVSEDGGKSFAGAGGGGHGDWHDVWIDPGNPQHVIAGDDGGLWISHDGGSRWWKVNNLPISQFYHVSLDNKDPYQVYGGLQDNSSWVGDSAYPNGISNQRWENLYGGDGFWTLVDPTDPDAVYAESQGGYIGRVDRRTHLARDIQPKAGLHEKLRFNWNTPIHLSPNVPGTLYIGAQFLFRSRDRGDSWERISPDLTTDDPEKQKQEQSGGITVDNSSAEMHTTLYSISESPLDGQVIWVGTDDGNLQLTRDGAATWHNVVGNVPGLPKASWVSWVEAGRFDPGTAYAAFDRHTFGDLDPYLFRTTDYGKSWTRIASPAQGVRGYAHVLKEDPVRQGLLFLGTEFGLWISVDAGATWAAFKGGDFPAVAVRDLQVQPRDGDLVVATHGRGIWIIDDLTPLRALGAALLAKEAAFLPGRPVQQRLDGNGGWADGDAVFVGENPPGGAQIAFYQKTRHLFGPLKLEVFDPSGKLIDTLPASKRRGLNRVSWSMQTRPPRVPRAAQVAFASSQGPRVLPGVYTLRLTKGTEVIETKLEIGLDRRAPWTVADRKLQYDAVMRAHALFGEMSTLLEQLEAAKAAAERDAGKVGASDALGSKLRALGARLEELKKKVVATKEGGAVTGEERLREHLDELYGALNGWEGKPARYQLERIEVLRTELGEVGAELQKISNEQIRPLQDQLQQLKLEPIPTEAPPAKSELEERGSGRVTAALLACIRAPATCTEAVAAPERR